ncbi:uncharacterized protein BDW43DRAFT_294411 [Aspergillus alliaceus]|uniref:uncharacterized protein n=1 Tax=Petromyces alliaceus TaxID=209559 RepID=UPI0012A3D25E|nr:uncharacterized protein BDW43DRAFT_294411 [Aspergillus alliaceus]KAB8227359.1 hypothetical protein BDW43DRAFT_294411 [Aspergillus alliaceus]
MPIPVLLLPTTSGSVPGTRSHLELVSPGELPCCERARCGQKYMLVHKGIRLGGISPSSRRKISNSCCLTCSCILPSQLVEFCH